MISITGSEALLGAAILLLVELSIHLRFRPLRLQLATIEHLLRRDQAELFRSLAEHGDQLEDHERRLAEIEGKIPKAQR